MNNYKRVLLISLIFFVVASLFATLYLKNSNQERGRIVNPEQIDEYNIERAKTLENINRLLPENQKTEEENQADKDLLEKGSAQGSANSDTELLNRGTEETEEDKRKKALLESLSN